MKQFVGLFQMAIESGKAHEQMLQLKKIRLHHRVLSKVSYNAFKIITEFSQIQRVKHGETIFRQDKPVTRVYFLLYGQFMVSIRNKSKQRVGDLVKAGNVLGEEGFFLKGQSYRETAECNSKEAGVLEVDALALSELGSTDFRGKAHNRLAF